MLAASAVALALRLYRLAFQSLWWDEGISLYLSAQGLDALVFAKDFALDLHPPLYHMALALWTAVVGSDVFSARSFSALLGVLNVPLLYLLVRRLATPGAGLVAAWLLAASPVHIFYSQESRMYTLVPLLATLSLLAFQSLLVAADRAGRLRAASAYAVATAAGLWSYYYVGLLVGAQNAVFAIRWQARRENGRWWVAAQAGTVALYLPWLVVFVGMMLGTDYWVVKDPAYVAPDLAGFLRTFGLAYAIGFSVVEPWGTASAVLFLAVGVASLGARRWRTHGGNLVLLAWLAIPVALAYLIASERAFVFPRFVLFSALAVYGLVGVGTATVGRRAPVLGAVLALALIASAAPGLSRQYANPRTAYASSDYLPLLARLGAMAEPGDLVLANEAWAAGYARSYLPEPRPALMWAPSVWDKDEGLAASEIAALLDRHEGVWLFTWLGQSPWQPSHVEEALARQATSRYVEQHGEFRLRLFAADPSRGVSMKATNRADVFGAQIRLAGAETTAQAPLSPGGQLDVTLVWEALARPETDFTVFTQLIGPDGKVHGQKDNPPVFGTHPTTAWQQGEIVVDRYRIVLADGAPAGVYRLIAGLYEPQSGRRLPVDGGDYVVLGSFSVEGR